MAQSWPNPGKFTIGFGTRWWHSERRLSFDSGNGWQDADQPCIFFRMGSECTRMGNTTFWWRADSGGCLQPSRVIKFCILSVNARTTMRNLHNVIISVAHRGKRGSIVIPSAPLIKEMCNVFPFFLQKTAARGFFVPTIITWGWSAVIKDKRVPG